MNFPQNLKYTSEHEWIRIEAGEIGLCSVSQTMLRNQLR